MRHDPPMSGFSVGAHLPEKGTTWLPTTEMLSQNAAPTPFWGSGQGER